MNYYLKKRFKINQDLYEELTCEEILLRYDPYLCRQSFNYYKYAEKKFFKHVMFITYEDIKQSASLGLIKAYEEYDIEKGFIFFTYMQWIIRGAMQRYVRDVTKVRLKRPSPYDYKDVSLDGDLASSHVYVGGQNTHISEIIADPHDDINTLIDDDFVHDLLSVLNEKEMNIINLRYFKNKTQVETQHIIGHSQACVSRSEKKALLKMRQHTEEIKMKEVDIMAKVKPSIKQVVKHFKEHANKSIKFTTAAKEYANSLGLSITTIINLLAESGEASEIKGLYFDSPNMKSVNNKIKAAIEEEIKKSKEEISAATQEDEAVCIKDLKTDDVKKIVEDVPGTSVEVTGEFDIIGMTVKFPNGLTVSYDKGEMKFNECNYWITRDQVIAIKESIDKALEIFDYLYK